MVKKHGGACLHAGDAAATTKPTACHRRRSGNRPCLVGGSCLLQQRRPVQDDFLEGGGHAVYALDPSGPADLPRPRSGVRQHRARFSTRFKARAGAADSAPMIPRMHYPNHSRPTKRATVTAAQLKPTRWRSIPATYACPAPSHTTPPSPSPNRKKRRLRTTNSRRTSSRRRGRSENRRTRNGNREDVLHLQHQLLGEIRRCATPRAGSGQSRAAIVPACDIDKAATAASTSARRSSCRHGRASAAFNRGLLQADLLAIGWPQPTIVGNAPARPHGDGDCVTATSVQAGGPPCHRAIESARESPPTARRLPGTIAAVFIAAPVRCCKCSRRTTLPRGRMA